MDIFESKEYKRSRTAYIGQQTGEYFVSLLVSDVFLAKLLSSLGISDALVGIISSFITLAFVIQFFSIFIIRVKLNAKYLVMILDTISSIFFMLLYLIPFFKASQTGKTLLVLFFLIFAYLGKYLTISIVFKWANSYVDPDKRASFSASKEMVSLFSGMIFTAFIGYMIDRYEGLGNLNGGFLFIASSILILNICNFICFCLIKKEPTEASSGDNASFSEIMKNTVGNKDFRKVIIISTLFNIGVYSSYGFMGIYKTKDLMYSAFFIQLVNIVANTIRMAISKPFGRYSDRTSFASGMRLGIILSAVAFFLNIFTTVSTRYLIIVFTIVYNCSVAGTNQNSFNIIYSYVDKKYITQALAIKNCISGIFGFGASVVAGKILGTIQANSNMIFGIQIYGQQLLSAISCVILILTVIYMNKTLLKKNS